MVKILDELIPNTIPPENWKPITNDQIHNICPGYWISTYGRLYSELTCKFYPNENFTFDKNKYVNVYLQTIDNNLETWHLHRLMLYIFDYKNDWESLVVNHIDGIKYHNWLWNLEWTTYSGNINHALENGLSKRGEDVSYSTINNKQAEMIANLLSQGFRPSQIQNQLKDIFPEGVRIKQIAIDMANGQSWKHIVSKYNMDNCYKNNEENKYIFSDEQVHEICKIFAKYGRKVTYDAILNYIGYNISNINEKEMKTIIALISQIRNKKTRKYICDLYDY